MNFSEQPSLNNHNNLPPLGSQGDLEMRSIELSRLKIQSELDETRNEIKRLEEMLGSDEIKEKVSLFFSGKKNRSKIEKLTPLYHKLHQLERGLDTNKGDLH